MSLRVHSVTSRSRGSHEDRRKRWSYLQVGGDNDRLRHVRGGEIIDPREAIVGRHVCTVSQSAKTGMVHRHRHQRFDSGTLHSGFCSLGQPTNETALQGRE